MCGIFDQFHGTAKDFLFLQQNCFPSFYQRPLSDRIEMAIDIAEWHGLCSDVPELFRTIIGQSNLESKDIQLESEVRLRRKTTLFHCVARNMGCWQREQEEVYSKSAFYNRDPGLGYELWHEIFQEYFCAGANIHHLVGGQTPFLAFLDGYEYSRISPRIAYDQVIRAWLEALQVAGVDLHKFGKKRAAHLEAGKCEPRLCFMPMA
jgi:hypothetical protein